MRPEHFLIVISFLSVLQPSQLHKTFLEQPAPKMLAFRQSMGRVTRFFQSEVDKGAIPGVVLVVARDSKVAYTEAIGYQVHNTIMNRFENFLLYFVFQQIQERRFVSL